MRGSGGRGGGDSRTRFDSNSRRGGGDRNRSRSRSPIRGNNNQRRSGAGGDRDRRGATGSSSNSSSANDRMVYITNIPYDVRWMELKTLVREKGGEINFLEMLEDQDGKPKGNAIVEFQKRDGAEKCVKNMEKYPLHGRNLVCKEIRDPIAFFRKVKEESGIDFLTRTTGGSGGAARGGAARGEPDSSRPIRTGSYDLFGLSPDFLRQHEIEPPLCDRVFVANLSYNVGTGKMYDIFGMAGKIVWMDLHMDKEGRSKGVCVIQFSHPIEAVQAISMFNGQRLYDRTLAVKMDKFEKVDKESDGPLPRGLEGVGMGLGVDGNALTDIASFLVMRAAAQAQPVVQQQPIQTPQYPPPSHSYNASVGPMANNYAGSYDNRGNPPMMGMNNSMSSGMGSMGGSGTAIPPPGYSNGSSHVSGGQSMAGGTAFADFIKKEVVGVGFGGGGYNSVQVSRIIAIKNLPTDYTWQIVRDRVQSFGDIEAVDLISPGIARVRFRHVQDAERTRTALSGTSVEGRPITVDFV